MDVVPDWFSFYVIEAIRILFNNSEYIAVIQMDEYKNINK